MSLVFMESWDMITTSSLYLKGWDIVGSGINIVSEGYTDQAIQFGNAEFFTFGAVQRQVDPSYEDETFTIGFRFNYGVLGASCAPVWLM